MAEPGPAGRQATTAPRRPTTVPPHTAAGVALSLAAPAKINLYLHVTGRRADGYHELDSLVAFAGVGDSVAVAPADHVGLTIDGPFAAGLPAGAENLVLKAAQSLARAAGVSAGAAITLTKRLPPASGIGGGSADAAAALRALIRFWEAYLDNPSLERLALDLGADVPVCLAGRAAFVAGVGERLTLAPPLPPAWLVLVNPGRALATAAVFAARGGPFSAPAPFAETPADTAHLAALLKARRNDLTEAALAEAPVVADVLAALEAAPGALLARMSGSGATCFALFANEAAARAAAARILAAQGAWWVAAAPLLNDGRAAEF